MQPFKFRRTVRQGQPPRDARKIRPAVEAFEPRLLLSTAALGSLAGYSEIAEVATPGGTLRKH